MYFSEGISNAFIAVERDIMTSFFASVARVCLPGHDFEKCHKQKWV
jgi:hypothetical protein